MAEAMNLSSNDIREGVRYNHNYLILPAVMTGKSFLSHRNSSSVICCEGTLCKSSPAHALQEACNIAPMLWIDASIPRSLALFFRWVARLCKKPALAQAACS